LYFLTNMNNPEASSPFSNIIVPLTADPYTGVDLKYFISLKNVLSSYKKKSIDFHYSEINTALIKAA